MLIRAKVTFGKWMWDEDGLRVVPLEGHPPRAVVAKASYLQPRRKEWTTLVRMGAMTLRVFANDADEALAYRIMWQGKDQESGCVHAHHRQPGVRVFNLFGTEVWVRFDWDFVQRP